MFDTNYITTFLEPLNLYYLSDDELYEPKQLGSCISVHTDAEFPDLEQANCIIIGVNDLRGQNQYNNVEPANCIRKQLYKMFYWHNDINIADLGNIITGKNITDTYAALASVIAELAPLNKNIIIIGGSNNIVLGQYQAFVYQKKAVEITGIDALIDINEANHDLSKNYLFGMLTGEPNYAAHYNHLGFQSYYVNPDLLQTIDKLKFDCFRVGKLKTELEEAEPLMRNSQIIYFDVAALASAFAPGMAISPNGFTGEEACKLSRYAGMALSAGTFGIYGYNPANDVNFITAAQIAQMVWYYFEGIQAQKFEMPITDLESYYVFKMPFSEFETAFLQSKKTLRWWMQIPNGKYIPCSYADYLAASRNDIPERWFRNQERTV
jgi:formiminoglutamase